MFLWWVGFSYITLYLRESMYLEERSWIWCVRPNDRTNKQTSRLCVSVNVCCFWVFGRAQVVCWFKNSTQLGIDIYLSLSDNEYEYEWMVGWLAGWLDTFGTCISLSSSLASLPQANNANNPSPRKCDTDAIIIEWRWVPYRSQLTLVLLPEPIHYIVLSKFVQILKYTAMNCTKLMVKIKTSWAEVIRTKDASTHNMYTQSR